MFNVIGFMLTGITLGYLFRNLTIFQKTEKNHIPHDHPAAVRAGHLRRIESHHHQQPG